MFRVICCVIRRGCFLWPVCSLGKTVSLCLVSFCTPRPNLSVMFIFSYHHSCSGSIETSPERLITLQVASWLLRWRHIYQSQDILMGCWTSDSFIWIFSILLLILYWCLLFCIYNQPCTHAWLFLIKYLPYALAFPIHLCFIYPYVNLDFMSNFTCCPSQVILLWCGFLWY